MVLLLVLVGPGGVSVRVGVGLGLPFRLLQCTRHRTSGATRGVDFFGGFSRFPRWPSEDAAEPHACGRPKSRR